MKKRIMCAIISAMLIASFTACSTQGGSGSQTSTADTAANKSAAASDEIKDGEYDLSFSQRDADSSYDESAAAKITFTDTSAESSSGSAEVSGTTVTIKSEGTYVVSGGCKDGKIVVDADEKAKVQVVFNGIDLTSSGSPFVVKSADKVFITLADGSENTVSDGSSYTDTVGETNVDAAIFSKEDLSINGSGKLTVNGNYKHGILSKDDLVVAGGTVSVKAVSTGVEGKDSLKIKDADLNVEAGSDAIRATNTEDTMNDGTVIVTSSDDGFNAAGGNNGTERQGMFDSDSSKVLTINGGYVYVDANGDGLDSNGVLKINGGTILVNGPSNDGNGALDSGSSCEVSGGTIIAIGSSGMAESLTANGQCSIMTDIDSQAANTTVALTDSEGNVLASINSTKQFNNVVVSTPSIKKGESYKLVCGGTVDGADSYGFADSGKVSGGTTAAEMTMDSESYSNGGSRMGGGMGGMRGNMQPPDGDNGNGMQPPDGNMQNKPQF